MPRTLLLSNPRRTQAGSVVALVVDSEVEEVPVVAVGGEALPLEGEDWERRRDEDLLGTVAALASPKVAGDEPQNP